MNCWKMNLHCITSLQWKKGKNNSFIIMLIHLINLIIIMKNFAYHGLQFICEWRGARCSVHNNKHVLSLPAP